MLDAFCSLLYREHEHFDTEILSVGRLSISLVVLDSLSLGALVYPDCPYFFVHFLELAY